MVTLNYYLLYYLSSLRFWVKSGVNPLSSGFISVMFVHSPPYKKTHPKQIKKLNIETKLLIKFVKNILQLLKRKSLCFTHIRD